MSESNLYTLFEEPMPVSLVESWHLDQNGFDKIIGYTSLGSLFLQSTDLREFAVLYPLLPSNNAKKYAGIGTVDNFERLILSDADFIDICLEPEKVSILTETVGILDSFEVYYPAPFPCLGGSGDIETYSKGNVWAFMEILRQSF